MDGETVKLNLNYLNPVFNIRCINGGVYILAIRLKMFRRLQYEMCYFTFYVDIVLGYFKISSNVQKCFAQTP